MSRKIPQKVYYNSFKQSFEDNNLERVSLPKDYDFNPKKGFMHFVVKGIYHLLAVPILKTVSFFSHSTRVINKDYLKELKGQGFFIYMNHSAHRDPYILQATLYANKYIKIIGFSDATQIKFWGKYFNSIGLVPIPNDIRQLRAFSNGLKDIVINDKRPVIIFPEGQMWPYCTFLRPLNIASFHYPAELNVPILPITTIYIDRKNPKRKPKCRIILSKPIYPNKETSVAENKKFFMEECQKSLEESMKSSTSKYVEYIHVEKDDPRFIDKDPLDLKTLYKEQKKTKS